MIQDFTNATGLVYYWGYGNRILPCKNDAGSCEYLEAIYHGHQLSVLYSWIMWVVIAALLLLALTIQLFTRFAPTSSRIDGESKSASRGGLYRGARGFLASFRRRLLPESLAGMFGHVSRVQLLALAGICAYLFIFTMVGIAYKKWVTPIKKSTLHNTRTGLGPWSDRIGIMAYALTPLTLLLASRESLLSLVTGIPHHHFMFLHRWSGRIIYVQSALHTIGWTVIEAKLYQPQPTVYKTLMAHQYIIFGVVAMLFLTFLTIFSTTAVIKRTGYEFFRKTHLIIATLYIGACWGHWDLLQCWMIASFAILAIDMGSRWIRFGLIHTSFKNGSHGVGFRAAQSTVKVFQDADATVVRMDFDHAHKPWFPGQHFYLTLPTLSIWQSHPYTPMSCPTPSSNTQHHTYIIRAMSGQTSQLAALASNPSTPVILNGPYGSAALDPGASNMLAVAGGTGISYTLPVVFEALQKGVRGPIHMVWVIRETQHLEWIQPELFELKRRMASGAADNVVVDIYVTRDFESISIGVIDEKPSLSSSSDSPRSMPKEADVHVTSDSSSMASDPLPNPRNYTVHVDAARPDVAAIVARFQDATVGGQGRSQVLGSGPASMGADLRRAVANANSGGMVWRGKMEFDVALSWDNRG